MKKVSIIIPTYNAESFIDKTIQSVINQTYNNWELIIVDDFSQDNTAVKLEKWKKSNDKINIIFLNKNSGGPAHPKNIGFLNSTGDYIAYLDHDDEWDPFKLEKQVAALEKDRSLGLVSCEAIVIDENNKIISSSFLPKIPNEGLFPEIFFKDFIISNSSMIIPREVIENIGGRDENVNIGVAEDREIEMRIACAGYNFHIIHEPLLKYRVHSKNTSSLGAPLCYAEANLKYINEYKKYKLEYLIFKRFAREYLKRGNIEKSREYCKLTLKQNKDSQLLFFYLLLFLGKFGVKISQSILKLRTKLKYPNLIKNKIN